MKNRQSDGRFHSRRKIQDRVHGGSVCDVTERGQFIKRGVCYPSARQERAIAHHLIAQAGRDAPRRYASLVADGRGVLLTMPEIIGADDAQGVDKFNEIAKRAVPSEIVD